MNERIKKILEELGLKRIDFANRLHISQPFASELCSGAKSPSERTISDICREFGVNESWLRTGEGEMFEQMTEQQKLLKYTGMLLKDKDSAIVNAIQSFIVTYEQLDDTSKATLEKISQQFIDNLKKSQ